MFTGILELGTDMEDLIVVKGTIWVVMHILGWDRRMYIDEIIDE